MKAKGSTKTCTRCKLPKPVDDFHWQDKQRKWRKAECKRCSATLGRLNRVRREHGLTMFDLEDLYRSQDHRCAICRQTEQETGRHFAVDHCHDSGKIRGLLCLRCNTAFGLLESPERLRTAARYLDGGTDLLETRRPDTTTA